MKKATFFSLLLFVFLTSNCLSQINWSEKTELAPSSFGNNRPRVTNDGNGNPIVIWGNDANLMFSKWNGFAFSTPIKLNPPHITIAEASWMGPEIASIGDTIYIVYKETPEHDTISGIYCLRSFDGGNNFELPVRVDNIGANLSRFSTIHVDNDGTVYVGFMKFDMQFMEPHWVVSKSTDQGATFFSAVEASNIKGPTSEACDCCPGTITSNGNNVAMMYRNNASNIRDSWIGISDNFGSEFTGNMNIDQHEWLINYCPSSGPDGIIVDNTLYSVFMNGATGTSLIYYNTVDLTDSTCNSASELNTNFSNLTQQNFPRITNLNNKALVIWKQVVLGKAQLQMMYTDSIQEGFNNAPYTVATNYVNNGDATVSADKLFIVWQDYLSGSIKYRFGNFDINNSVQNIGSKQNITVSPNPSNDFWNIKGVKKSSTKLTLLNSQHQQLSSKEYNHSNELISLDNQHLPSGIYFLHIINNYQNQILKLIKQ